MDKFDLEKTLDTFTILVDTREQETSRYRKRVASFGCPYERYHVAEGDYSAKVTLPNGEDLILTDKIVVERKMDLDEIIGCFTEKPANDELKEKYKALGVRNRFEYELLRAKKKGIRMYIFIENASLDKVLRHDYRSRMHPNALLGTFFAYIARYDLKPIFCTDANAGRLLKEILYRETKEILNGMD